VIRRDLFDVAQLRREATRGRDLGTDRAQALGLDLQGPHHAHQRLTLQARQPEHRLSRLVDKLAVPVHGRPGGAARHGAQRLVCHLGRRIVGRGGRPVRAQLLEPDL